MWMCQPWKSRSRGAGVRVGCEQRQGKFKGKILAASAITRKKVTRVVTTKELNIVVSPHCLVREREERSGLSHPQRKSEVNVKN